MSEKRKRSTHDDGQGQRTKRPKQGFQVGPANLPDGSRRRHSRIILIPIDHKANKQVDEKLKRNLIERANIKKQYAKMKRQIGTRPGPEHDTENDVPATSEPHPDRAEMINEQAHDSDDNDTQARSQGGRQRKGRYDTFSRHTREANRRKAEAEERRIAREEAQQERQERIAERERHRKAMAKARTATGQRKLGRESVVLLDKVKRLVKT